MAPDQHGSPALHQSPKSWVAPVSGFRMKGEGRLEKGGGTVLIRRRFSRVQGSPHRSGRYVPQKVSARHLICRGIVLPVYSGLGSRQRERVRQRDRESQSKGPDADYKGSLCVSTGHRSESSPPSQYFLHEATWFLILSNPTHSRCRLKREGSGRILITCCLSP